MDEPAPLARVVATEAALAAIARLWSERGPVIFFQSGGCCDGSVPMCFDEGELAIGPADILLGAVGGAPFYMWAPQFEAFQDNQFILDVEVGSPGGFSLPADDEHCFVVKLRVLNDQERAALRGPPQDRKS